MKIAEIPSDQAPMSLLLLADPSEAKIRSYLKQSHCFAAQFGAQIIGLYLILPRENFTYELINIAVAPEHQRQGIGYKLLSHAMEVMGLWGAKKLLVGTGTFGYQLMFYQRAGFRVVSVERDFFLTNYREPIFEHGIQHKDMLRLEIEFRRSPNFSSRFAPNPEGPFCKESPNDNRPIYQSCESLGDKESEN